MGSGAAMSVIRTWLRAQREARNREAYAQLVAEHPPIPELGPDIDADGRNYDGQPYELSPNHPLATAGPKPLPVFTVESLLAPEGAERFRRLIEETEREMFALSGLPGGGRWLPPRS
jgi:hypothetical protein